MRKGCRFASLLISLSCLLLGACGPSDHALAELGRHATIQANAPIKATSTLTIHAPAPRVWNVLTDLGAWSQWQSGVGKVTPMGMLGPGTSFTWETGGMTIHSEVVLFDPPSRLAWIGRAYTAHAVHVFTLTPLGPSATRVESSESMDGPLVDWFYDSATLQASEDLLMQSLKRASEVPRKAPGIKAPRNIE